MAAAAAADAKGDQPKVAQDGTVIQDDDERKYDRQMRLWGAHGQKRLQEAHIAVLHSGPTATESLKNLVLPNVGAFTVIDHAKVTAADLGNNWFVDKSHVGQPRAKAVTELLLEMNPEVKGHALEADPVVQIDTKIESFAAYQLVIACQLPEASVKKLAAFLYARSIPLVVVRSIGLFGYMRSVFPEQTVVESHPINDRTDIYVHPKQIALWPELAKYCESFDFAKVDARTHRHIPYIAILHQQMKKWQSANGGKVPTSADETKAFRAAINAARLNDPSAPPAENFDEAVQNAHRAFRLPELDDKVVAVLEDAKGQPANITKASSNYWVLVAALNAWRADPKGGAGVLMPVSTNIPDMHSFSDLYIQLKDIFAEKAKADLAAITAHVNALTAKAGRGAVPAKEIDLFVKQCRCLYVVRTRSVEQELDAKTFPTDDVNDKLTDYVDLKDQEREEGVLKGPHNLHWYFALRAAERFHDKHKRYPGQTPAVTDDTSADLKELSALAAALYAELKVDAQANDQVLKEFVRYGMSEVHGVAAFMGGMAAQEALKLLIGQYVPNNNTVIYNAVHASLSHFKF